MSLEAIPTWTGVRVIIPLDDATLHCHRGDAELWANGDIWADRQSLAGSRPNFSLRFAMVGLGWWILDRSRQWPRFVVVRRYSRGEKSGRHAQDGGFRAQHCGDRDGYDPSTSQMKYYWRRWGSHMEIFPSDGKVWMWPSHGIRIDSRLVVFCSRVQNNPKKESLGFEGVGSQAFVIENPDVEPTDWKMKTVMKDGAEVGGSVERCEKDLPSAGRRSSARANVRGQSPSRVEGRGFDHHLRDQWIG